MRITFRTSIFVIIFIGLSALAVVENRIFVYLEESVPHDPQIAGTTAGVNAIVPETPYNTPSPVTVGSGEKTMSQLFIPSPQALRILYGLVLLLIVLVLVNIYYDVRVLKRRLRVRS